MAIEQQKALPPAPVARYPTGDTEEGPLGGTVEKRMRPPERWSKPATLAFIIALLLLAGVAWFLFRWLILR